MELSLQEREFLLQSIREIKDFPQEGILFRDITTLLNNPKAFSFLMEHLIKRYQDYCLDCIAGIESRGFIFGSILANRLNLAFVPIRKKGKLPYTTISEKYTLEYGFSEIEVHIDAFSTNSLQKVLLIDDLIATGGTAYAAANLIKKAGAKCVESCFILNLKDLKGAEKLQSIVPVYSVLEI